MLFLLTGCAWIFADDHAALWPADTTDTRDTDTDTDTRDTDTDTDTRDSDSDCPIWYDDLDGDGLGDALSEGIQACEQPEGLVDNDDDCWDGNAEVTDSAFQVHLEDVDGVLRDLTPDWITGEDGSPFVYPLDTDGILRVCRGTWFVRIEASKAVTVTLTGTAPAADVVLDAGKAGRGLYLPDQASMVLQHLTIANANVGEDSGGAIWVDGASLYMEDCVLRNSSAGTGAGLYISGPRDGKTIWMSKCEVYENAAKFEGGGVAIFPVDSDSDSDSAILILSVMNSVIRDNEAQKPGGGLSLGDGATLVMAYSEVTGNTSQEGGGLAASGAKITLVSSSVTANTAQYGAGVALSDDSILDCGISGTPGGFWANEATGWGGAAWLTDDSDTTLTSESCDWTGSKDNKPHDIAIGENASHSYGDEESFFCDSSGCR